MIILLSPAKKIDSDLKLPKSLVQKCTKPKFYHHTTKLLLKLKSYSPSDLQSLLKISDKLAKLNYHRFQDFELNFNQKQTIPACYAFKGDTYVGLDIDSFDQNNVFLLNQQVKILSGLYGMLCPLDGINPYRLEMGCKFAINKHQDLYQFWSSLVTKELNQTLAKATTKNRDKIIINCASNEYAKVVDIKKLDYKLITICFKEINHQKQAKTIGLYAKKARGAFCQFCIKNNITRFDQLSSFNLLGYQFQKHASKDDLIVFARNLPNK